MNTPRSKLWGILFILKSLKKDGRSHYLDWSKKLDKSMSNNDINEFSKNYSIGNSSWKEKYKNSHPEHIDIIDGANIGLFSLKN